MNSMLNVVDVEATCWNGRPPQGQRNEIIEIGLCVVDIEARKRVSKHRIMVRPATSYVSPFCTELTGHTQDDVDRGVDFATACRQLRDEHDAGSRPWTSWGDYDRKQFGCDCETNGVPYPFSPEHLNAKQLFATARGHRRGSGMARALKLSELPLEGRHHNGADDAWNIAALVLRMAADGDWP